MKRRILEFSGIRIYLAISIFVCHWALMAGNLEEIKRNPFIHGGYAVSAFLLMSGFLICEHYYSYFEILSREKYLRFMRKHLSSLYGLYVITLIPQLLILIIKLCMSFSVAEFGKLLLRGTCNFLMLQSFVPYGQSYSINGVSWYLSCILILYAMFPIMVKLDRLFIRNNVIRSLAIAISFLMIIVLEPIDWLYASPLYRFFQFFIGMQLSRMIQERKVLAEANSNILKDGIIIGVNVAADLCLFGEPLAFWDTLAFAMFMFFCVTHKSHSLQYFLCGKRTLSLSRLSTPIFLIHYPIINVFGSRMHKFLLGKIGVVYSSVLVGSICLILTFALSVLYLKIEEKKVE